MGIFNNLFSSKNDSSDNENDKIQWNELVSTETLDEIVEVSQKQTVAIFKHSTRCIISSRVLKRFEQNYDLNNQVKMYFLDLLKHRDISNQIASRFMVHHESPQLIVIKKGKVIYHASHNEIQTEKLSEIIAKLG
ncbi:MAG: bacillithiol system redox-active protein YtxJ [Bacteroidota bacterium]|nr:bacillithiol system redox-active protein YtxJ [Bacteroidota bacterium]